MKYFDKEFSLDDSGYFTNKDIAAKWFPVGLHINIHNRMRGGIDYFVKGYSAKEHAFGGERYSVTGVEFDFTYDGVQKVKSLRQLYREIKRDRACGEEIIITKGNVLV